MQSPDLIPEQHTPVVSVLIAAYKDENFEEALASALHQTHADLEVVVVDDSPATVIEDVVRRLDDSRIVYVRNSQNLGPGASYERALRAAKGQYAAVLNDDDFWEPTFVATLLRELQREPRAVLAFSDHWVVRGRIHDDAETDRSYRHWKRDRLSPGLHQPFYRLALIDGSIPMAISALFELDALPSPRSIPAAVGGAYDLYLAYLVSATGRGAIYVNERLSNWRIHPHNLTRVPSVDRSREAVVVLRQIYEDPRVSAIRPDSARLYSSALAGLAGRQLRVGDRREALYNIAASACAGRLRSLLLLPLLVAPERSVRAVSGSRLLRRMLKRRT